MHRIEMLLRDRALRVVVSFIKYRRDAEAPERIVHVGRGHVSFGLKHFPLFVPE